MPLLQFIVRFVLLSLGFALGLALLITILGPGLPIIQHGIPLCGLLAQEGMLSHMLYTACGCAVVEIILIPVGLLLLWLSISRLFQLLGDTRNRKP